MLEFIPLAFYSCVCCEHEPSWSFILYLCLRPIIGFYEVLYCFQRDVRYTWFCLYTTYVLWTFWFMFSVNLLWYFVIYKHGIRFWGRFCYITSSTMFMSCLILDFSLNFAFSLVEGYRLTYLAGIRHVSSHPIFESWPIKMCSSKLM